MTGSIASMVTFMGVTARTGALLGGTASTVTMMGTAAWTGA